MRSLQSVVVLFAALTLAAPSVHDKQLLGRRVTAAETYSCPSVDTDGNGLVKVQDESGDRVQCTFVNEVCTYSLSNATLLTDSGATRMCPAKAPHTYNGQPSAYACPPTILNGAKFVEEPETNSSQAIFQCVYLKGTGNESHVWTCAFNKSDGSIAVNAHDSTKAVCPAQAPKA